MSDDSGQSGLTFAELIKLKEARLAEQAAAIDLERTELAELKRLAAKHLPDSGVQLLELQLPGGDPKVSDVNGSPSPQTESAFNGTLGGLVRLYQSDPRSSYHQLRHHVRKNQAFTLDRIVNERGTLRLADLTKADLEDLYKFWSANGKKIAMGRLALGKIRTMLRFGGTILEDAECQRLSGVFQILRFETTKPRVERLTETQANDVCAAAHKKGWGSIALAQAFQFESELRQKDVIGEWVPVGDAGTSDIINSKSQKWVRGLRWSQIDDNLMLHHVTSFSGKKIEIDLKGRPMIARELESKYGALTKGRLPGSGPIIRCEHTNLPWTGGEFRRKWRIVADLAGVPKTVKNMDSIRSVGADEPHAADESDEEDRQTR